MDATLTDLRSQFALLSPQQRESFLTQVAYDDSRTSRDLSHEQMLVYDALMQACEIRIPVAKFLSSYGARKYGEKVAEIYELISATRKFLRQPQVVGLLAIVLRCLAAELKARNAPVTPQTMLNSLSLLRCAVDRRFPGYLEAGLLHRVVPSASEKFLP